MVSDVKLTFGYYREERAKGASGAWLPVYFTSSIPGHLYVV